jgi:hypothetical protein
VHAKDAQKSISWQETENKLDEILSTAVQFKGEYLPTSLRCGLREQAVPEPDYRSAQVSTIVLKPSPTLASPYKGLGCKDLAPVSHSSFQGDGFYFQGKIADSRTVFLLDSGAQINVIGTAQFKS